MTKKSKQLDYEDFNNSNELSPPNQLDSIVLNHISEDLSPDSKVVFLKLSIVQLFVGTISLLFCPQFNLSLTNNQKLFHYIHHMYGENLCMSICGGIFIGSGVLFASYILKQSEVNLIKKSKTLYFFGLTSLSLMALVIAGAEVYFTVSLFWILGSVISALLVFEFSRIVRREVFRY